MDDGDDALLNLNGDSTLDPLNLGATNDVEVRLYVHAMYSLNSYITYPFSLSSHPSTHFLRLCPGSHSPKTESASVQRSIDITALYLPTNHNASSGNITGSTRPRLLWPWLCSLGCSQPSQSSKTSSLSSEHTNHLPSFRVDLLHSLCMCFDGNHANQTNKTNPRTHHHPQSIHAGSWRTALDLCAEPVQPLVQTLTCHGACALDVPEIMQ